MLNLDDSFNSGAVPNPCAFFQLNTEENILKNLHGALLNTTQFYQAPKEQNTINSAHRNIPFEVIL